MACNRIQAGRLLAASELAVFEASLGETLTALTASKLRALVKRTRNMRDKAQDLLQRQRMATRGRTGSKDGTAGAANERTAEKLRVLGEALARFEHRLVQLDAAAERAASATLRASERLSKLKQRTQTPARRAAVGGPGKAAPATAPKVGAKTAARPTPSAPTAARHLTAKLATPVSLKSAVKQAVAATQATQDQLAGRAPARSAKAPATAPTGGHGLAFGEPRRRRQGHEATAQVHRQSGHPGAGRCAGSSHAGQARQALSVKPMGLPDAHAGMRCRAHDTARNPLQAWRADRPTPAPM